MKKALFLLMVVVMVSSANAIVARNNGGFDADAAGWNAAGGGAWSPGHVTTGGNPGGYLTLLSGSSTWSCWYQVINEDLAVWGIPAGTTINVQSDMIDLGTAGNNSICGLKIESYTSSGTKIEEYPQEYTITTAWATYSFAYKIPTTATNLKLVLTNVNYNGLGDAKFGYDNVGFGFSGRTPALFPIPTVGNKSVGVASDVLSWTNPSPLKNPSDTVTCDMWFRESATALSDPNLVAGQPGVSQIATGIVGNSLDLSSVGVTLKVDTYYYWKVNVVDPNNGGNPIQINGFTWSFYTGDAIPVVNAGADQYVWLTMNDGTPADGKVTFTLNGSYTDDAKSAVTTTWALDTAQTQTDPATIVTIGNPSVSQGTKAAGNHVTSVTIDNTGWFFFTFTATDGSGASTDTVNVGVYVDACTAANEDPADMPARYTNGHGDIDGDCDVDMADFAILAETWLDCMSDKLGCNP